MKDEVERLRIRVEKAWHERQKCSEELRRSTIKNNHKLLEKFRLIDNKYWLLRDKMDYYDATLIEEDDEIAIKRFGDDIENMYFIFLKDEKTRIGHIDYQGYHTSNITGDIGYYIDKKYNGHNYAYKALCLLSNYLYKNGIKDFYISVFHDNVASIKIIKKYGGNIIFQDELLTAYQCETRKKNNMKGRAL